MLRVAEFEKVSYEQFYSAACEYMEKYGSSDHNQIQSAYDVLPLPKRATSGSAGYDFKAPFDFTLKPGQTVKILTGIRVRVDDGWWLGCFPRSGLGFKYRLQLANTVGIIDSDYYEADNEGHIMLKLINNSEKHLDLSAGTAIAQGIFLPIGFAVEDEVENIRQGGLGSTSDK